ncbi:response regulator transcription factor [Vagococcus sp. PNs007]|uniref:Response regulator transcription factor n=1 Tax=Vagococcus proximus TaxID=2991417 RepID=A0ABT5X124_9ENTE|nr:response regulator transcription factor [Vagococcus proximus]
MTNTILVVDDDKEIRQAVRIYLEQKKYTVVEAVDGLDALKKLEETMVHLIILDVMMPRLDGIATMQKIRESKNVPILMLSAKNEEVDKVMGLTNGADDYLSKPFSPLELLARVESLLRRYLSLGEFETTQNADILEVNGLILDRVAKKVMVEGQNVKLTRTEFKITELLMMQPGRVYSIDEIYETVWQEPSFNSDNTVSVHIRKIREKIEVNPKNPKYLKVVWGVGYKIEK